ncbi:MAG: flagellar basal body rod protein FlgB [Tranquillimonas sp.]|jgi:flagellar basal-body rod protein FlgB
MNLESMSFFRLASDRMQWLSARQKVVAENVANADTPNYKARDISSFEEMLRGRGGAGGLLDAGTPDGVRVVQDEAAWQQSIDGNTVLLEQQTIKASDISENYRMAAQLYRKGYELLTLAASSDR